MQPPTDETVTLLPLADLRAAVAAARLHLHVLAPQHAAVGCGTLRVLRARDTDEGLEVVAGYDRYESWPREAKR